MSSPKTSEAKAALSGQDKTHFLKAMWGGVQGKDAKPKAEAPNVEVLRKSPAQTVAPTRKTPESSEAMKLASVLEKKLVEGELDVLTPEAMQTLMAPLVKIYSANAESGERVPILDGRMSVTGTDAMIVCGALLKAADLHVLELGMWQSWSGM